MTKSPPTSVADLDNRLDEFRRIPRLVAWPVLATWFAGLLAIQVALPTIGGAIAFVILAVWIFVPLLMLGRVGPKRQSAFGLYCPHCQSLFLTRPNTVAMLRTTGVCAQCGSRLFRDTVAPQPPRITNNAVARSTTGMLIAGLCSTIAIVIVQDREIAEGIREVFCTILSLGFMASAIGSGVAGYGIIRYDKSFVIPCLIAAASLLAWGYVFYATLGFQHLW